MDIHTELEAGTRLAVAGVIGLVVGLERQWSGHASGPDARFAGLRTFLMLGLLGGSAGLFAEAGHEAIGVIVFGGGAALAVVAYVAAARRLKDADGTTETAALLVLALGGLAGTGSTRIAAAAGALIVFALSHKERLHRLVRRIGQAELRAALQFSVLAVVVLPFLPEGPYFGALAIRPRALWTVVLVFLALNFASYIARRAVGARRGYGIAGAIGGLMSSTAVTLTFARRSAGAPELAIPLARGVIGACTVLIPRILIVGTFINPAVGICAAPILLPAFLVGAAFVAFGFRDKVLAGEDLEGSDRNPLRLLQALEMAIAFQVALSALAWVGPKLGDIGVYGTATALGLTDMDALTVSMSSPSSGLDPSVAARALGVGVIANSVFKLAMAALIGRGAFRWRVAMGLGLTAVVTLGVVLLS